LEEIKSFQGFKNKQMVGKAIKLLKDAGFKSSHIFSSFGEDSAALEIDSENLLLFHADSIVESLINADPWGAGFFSVAVNVNDINAAGGLPIALVYVVSYLGEYSC